MILPWAKLRPGDRIGVITPCGPISALALAEGSAVIQSWGCEVVLGAYVEPHLSATADEAPGALAEGSTTPARGQEDHHFLAGPDGHRLADLHWALNDPSLSAVMIGRGGYGISRIVDRVQLASTLPRRPVIGFSDVTCLHEKFAAAGLPSIHGPNVSALRSDSVAADSLRSLLFDHQLPSLFTDAVVLRHGTSQGVLRGGNLTILAANAGTPSSLPGLPFVAVLEDTNEPPYKVDRMLTQLLRSGWFENATGVLSGKWSGCGDQNQVQAILAERLLSEIDGPIVTNASFGHDSRNLALPLGVPVELSTAPPVLRGCS